MPVAPYDPYAPVNPWWRQQQAPQAFPLSQSQDATARQQQRNANDPPDSTPSMSGQPSSQRPQPSLLQMLMLGGPATYSGIPKGGAPSGSFGAIPGMGAGGMNMGSNPWAWLGSMWGGGAPGPG